MSDPRPGGGVSSPAACVAYASVAGVVCGLVAGVLSGWVTVETAKVTNTGALQRYNTAQRQRDEHYTVELDHIQRMETACLAVVPKALGK